VYKEVESKYQRGEKALKADFESLQKVRKVLIDEKKHIRFGDWNAFDIEVGAGFQICIQIMLPDQSQSSTLGPKKLKKVFYIFLHFILILEKPESGSILT